MARLSNVLLDDILADQLLKINRFAHRGREYHFDLEDAHEAIRRLRPRPDKAKGLRGTNQEVYDLLVLGTTITQRIGGDTKSYSFRYIDWERPGQQRLSRDRRDGGRAHRQRQDPPLRCGRVRERDPLRRRREQAADGEVGEGGKPADRLPEGGQHPAPLPFRAASSRLEPARRSIRHSRHRRQVLAGLADFHPQSCVGPSIATDAPPPPPPHTTPSPLQRLVNRPLAVTEARAVYSGDFTHARPYFDALSAEGSRSITIQDRTIHALCRPERLLDLVRRFTVFDGGVRKIARHQQYFAVHRAMERVKHFDLHGRRKGGVIWHTQGSGKSLTMVMLGRALALDHEIVNPRIIIVTDRRDLDRQIKDTFKSCEMEPVRARSGRHLLQLIRDRTPLVTTIVNKFETALRHARKSDHDPNIFVLVDESHRSHTGRHGRQGLHGGHSQLGKSMRRLLPKACYLGFTGTPLLSREKSTFATFGGLIHQYAIDQAVEDGAVVPLLYEGRLVDQQVTAGTIDLWFDKHCRGLTEDQKADLKRKFSRMDALSRTEQAINAKALDISEHYREHWQGTGFKAQLVAPSKAAAIRFKEVLDEIGYVTSEIVISAPDDREGHEEIDKESRDAVQRFWAKTMERYRSESEYNRQVIEAFKGRGDPEILIVVSKLLTGFDAPRNTVLYVCKSLREHTLLQAIARVNRLHEEDDGTEKKFGFIIDYEGLLGELDQALTTYSAFEGYDPEDLVGTVRDVRQEIARLRDHHANVWDRFREVENKKDMEAMEQYLADEAIRQDFYKRLRAFTQCLHISLSSEKIHDVFDDREIEAMKGDWKRFSELRRSVRLRYQEVVDIKEYEPKIRRLLDDHVAASPAETIIELVDIHDSGALRAVVEETGTSDASKADRIASATQAGHHREDGTRPRLLPAVLEADRGDDRGIPGQADLRADLSRWREGTRRQDRPREPGSRRAQGAPGQRRRDGLFRHLRRRSSKARRCAAGGGRSRGSCTGGDPHHRGPPYRQHLVERDRSERNPQRY